MHKIKIIQGDITEQQVNAVVNSNNTHLIGGEGQGTNGAIIEKGGSSITDECKVLRVKMGEIPPGEAVLTTAGDLPAKHVIHTVGPVWQGGDNHEEMRLTDCYENCLRLAVKHGLKSIAFPNIGTGSYGFPKDIAAEISVGTCEWFLRQEDGEKIEEIIFVCHNKENYDLCTKELERLKERATK